MSTDLVRETPAPSRLVARNHDWSQQTGFAMIVMGTDRMSPSGPASTKDGLGHVNAPDKGRGTWSTYIVSGLADLKSNPDCKNDRASIYISQKTKVDENNGTTFGPTQSNDTSAVSVRSDALRFIARSSPPSGNGSAMITMDDGSSYVFIDKDQVEVKFKNDTIRIESSGITVKSENKVVVDAPAIEVAQPATDEMIKGKTYTTAESMFLDALLAYTSALLAVPPLASPMATPTATFQAAIASFKTAGSNSLSTKVKVG